MRVLHLTNKPIYPLVDGGCVAMNQIAKLLQLNQFETKNLTLETQKHPFLPDEFPADFRTYFRPEAVKINTNVTIFGALKSALNNESYNIARFINVDFEAKLTQILEQNNFDFIICESIFLLPYHTCIRKNSKAKIVVRAHNVEFNIWKGLAQNARFPKSTYLNYLSRLLKKAEVALLQNCDGILCISKNDEQTFKSLGISTPMRYLPVFMDETDKKVDCSSTKFHHIGAMNWEPNVESVRLLMDKIFPKIKTQIPSAELHLAGSFFPESITSMPEKGIFVHGFVADKFNFINDHGIQLIPLMSGSGVRIKILESMSFGVPIVTTSTGAEGIIVTSGTELLIAKQDDDFVQKAIDLNKNGELRQQIGSNASKFVAENYSFTIVNKQFVEFIESIS